MATEAQPATQAKRILVVEDDCTGLIVYELITNAARHGFMAGMVKSEWSYCAPGYSFTAR
jgi:two-component sensor histidine kinase